MRKYGWLPDLPDHRDLRLSAQPPVGGLPPQVDLRPFCPPVYDQGNLGSCTANAIAGALQFEQMKQKEADFVPSRLQIYYDERVREGSVNSDAGAFLRDAAWVVANHGAAPETFWPYIESAFATKPSALVYTVAMKYEALKYMRIDQTLDQTRAALASGIPFVFGFSVYESFQSQEVADTGIVPMPGKNESLVGGHAVMAVGFNDLVRRYLVRNSWGASWGQAGYFTIPYDYVLNGDLADDLWVIQLVK